MTEFLKLLLVKINKMIKKKPGASFSVVYVRYDSLVYIVYSLRFDSVEIFLWAACHAFSLHHSACEAFYSELV